MANQHQSRMTRFWATFWIAGAIAASFVGYAYSSAVLDMFGGLDQGNYPAVILFLMPVGCVGIPVIAAAGGVGLWLFFSDPGVEGRKHE